MIVTRIDLGLASPRKLGRLDLDPAVREIRRDDGAAELVEHRVMQVLLALIEARGRIVRREELTERCWEGRIVGEDALNRVISRLRRVADGIGKDSFRIETITKIGYRLTELEEGVAKAVAPTASIEQGRSPSAPRLTRRGTLVGAAAAGVVTLAGGTLWWRDRRPALSPPAREAMERGMAAFRTMTLDHLASAAAYFRQAAALEPDSAEPWGRLAIAYRWMYRLSHGETARLDAQRAREAANKALALDPDNGDAQATLATLQPEFRNWLAYDAACRPVLASHPDEMGINMLYLDLMSNVGRIRACVGISRRLRAADPDWPFFHSSLILGNWCLGRLDDADTVMDGAFRQWPRDINIWFVRQRLLAYSGRAAAALAMIEDVDNRPLGLPGWDFDLAAAESRALLTRSKADVDAASALYWDKARQSVGEAVNACQFFAAIGRKDDAFAILEATYLNRGFHIGDRYFAEEQGTYAERRNRPTWLLWLPFMADLRADPRMAGILHDIGLIDYWQRSRTRPDFAVAGFA
ncbi:MAG: hypothetical protein JWO25_879 [Alphaproteobacteria bacterium]|nr:hypothetical protein [Alphaproteobacteria bacterium]